MRRGRAGSGVEWLWCHDRGGLASPSSWVRRERLERIWRRSRTGHPTRERERDLGTTTRHRSRCALSSIVSVTSRTCDYAIAGTVFAHPKAALSYHGRLTGEQTVAVVRAFGARTQGRADGCVKVDSTADGQGKSELVKSTRFCRWHISRGLACRALGWSRGATIGSVLLPQVGKCSC